MPNSGDSIKRFNVEVRPAGRGGGEVGVSQVQGDGMSGNLLHQDRHHSGGDRSGTLLVYIAIWNII